MSGIVGSRLNIRGSGIVAQLGTDGQVLTSAGAGVAAEYEDAAGGTSWQSVVTGSTMTAVAGNGYPINTTSNTCTITLPASASAGDTIVFADYARTWGTNKIIIDSNGLNYQGDADTFTVEYETDGQSITITYMDATKGWVPTIDDDVTDVPAKGNARGIFAYGYTSGNLSMSNLVSNTGVVATDVDGVGTARSNVKGTQYGSDTAICAYGIAGSVTAVSNKVSNTGVVATDVSGVGTARERAGACSYGTGFDKGIFAFGVSGAGNFGVSNLVSNTGVIASDVSAVGTARYGAEGCEYGDDKGVFAYGYTTGVVSLKNLVANTGVVATDVTGGGTARHAMAACSYGGDKGIFGYGYSASSIVSVSNLVNSSGTIATDVTGVGTARFYLAACEYGQGKGIFGYGENGGNSSLTNLVSDSGVVATDTSGVGTGRAKLAGCSFA